MKNRMGLWGRFALLTTAVIWGSSFVILKNAIDGLGVMWVLAMRFTISAVLLLALAGKRLRSMSRASVRGSVLIGVCLAAAYIVQTYGLKYTTPGKNAFLTTTYCVMVPFLAWLVYKRKPGLHNVAAAVLCVAGIGFVALDAGFGEVNTGDVLTVFSGVFYALQIILMEQYISGCDSLSVSAVEFSTAAVICLVGTFAFEGTPVMPASGQIFAVLYLAVMCTALCFFLQAWGMKYTPSSTAAMIMTLEAVFGTIFSVILYHEQVTPRLLAGFALIFVAVVLSETGTELLKKLRKQ